jgi:hypothetical protein
VNNLQDCRAQEAQCRRRAASDEQNRDLWLSMAERWSYLCFRESTPFQMVTDPHGAHGEADDGARDHTVSVGASGRR